MADGILNHWTIANIPPEGHKDLGQFCARLFVAALEERERLGLPARWARNYREFRNRSKPGRTLKPKNIVLNFFFSNVMRVVANMTNRDPVSSLKDLELGSEESDAPVMEEVLKEDWQATGSKKKFRRAGRRNEMYGFVVRKPVWRPKVQYVPGAPGPDGTPTYTPMDNGRPDMLVLDPFHFLPAPGNWDDFAAEAPYGFHLSAMSVSLIEQNWPGSAGKVEAEETRQLLGGVREGLVGEPGQSYEVFGDPGIQSERDQKGLVMELWIRDRSVGKDGMPKYPGGVRVITLTRAKKEIHGTNILILDDRPNPLINWELPLEGTSQCFLYDKLPFFKCDSYEDDASFFGFSLLEQTEDLTDRMNRVFGKALRFVEKVLAGTLVIPPQCNITDTMLKSDKPILAIRTKSVYAAQHLRYLEPPKLPPDVWKIIEFIIQAYDRVWAIEDADRGVRPAGVVAAEAVALLQERNAVLLGHKIEAMTEMARIEGDCRISLWQNHGHIPRMVEVAGEMREFQGTKFLGRRLQYSVQQGSTMPRSQHQLAEKATELYRDGVLDRKANLELNDIPEWKAIDERMGASDIENALNILIENGLPEELVNRIYTILSQPQAAQTEEKPKPREVA